METNLDACIAKCPSCGALHAEASWYAIGLSSDMDCKKCGRTFNASKYITDRTLVAFNLNEKGRIISVRKEQLVEKPKEEYRLPPPP